MLAFCKLYVFAAIVGEWEPLKLPVCGRKYYYSWFYYIRNLINNLFIQDIRVFCFVLQQTSSVLQPSQSSVQTTVQTTEYVGTVNAAAIVATMGKIAQWYFNLTRISLKIKI